MAKSFFPRGTFLSTKESDIISKYEQGEIPKLPRKLKKKWKIRAQTVENLARKFMEDHHEVLAGLGDE